MGDIIEVDFRQNHDDVITVSRQHRNGETVQITFPAAEYRAMDIETLEAELEDMENDLDDTVDAIEEFEAEFGDPSAYEGDVLEDYEALLDERFAVELYIRQVLALLS